MKDTYELVTQVNGKEDMLAILAVLRDIKAGVVKNDLKLLNYYHEVPVSYSAGLDIVEVDTVEMTVHQAQAAVLGLQKQTLLKSSHFPSGLGVHCFVEYVNVRNCMVVLGRFAYATIRADRRSAVRVKVGIHIPTTYQADQQTIIGELKDISVTGMAVISSESAPAGIADDGFLKLTLMGTSLMLKAVIIRSAALENGYLHTFRVELDPKLEGIISQFIYSRQVEIIRELKEHAE